VNIAPVKIKKEIYPLTDWTIECAKKAGFIHIDNEKYPLPPKLGAYMEEKLQYEPAPVFQKPEV
jgi:hypothetical protein